MSANFQGHGTTSPSLTLGVVPPPPMLGMTTAANTLGAARWPRALGLLEAADTLGWMEATSTSHALEAHALGAAPPPALRS